MSIAKKLQTIAENEQKVYDKGYSDGAAQGGGGYDQGFAEGKQAEYDALWDALQDYGNLKNYNRKFYRSWEVDILNPKYPIVPTDATSMCQESKFKNVAESAVFDFSNTTQMGYMFCSSRIERVPFVIDTRAANSIEGLFGWCSTVEYIEKVILRDDGSQRLAESFWSTSKLKEIRIEGKIGTTIGFNASPLSKESILSILAALDVNVSGCVVYLSLAAVKKAFETSEGANDGTTSAEWQALIAPLNKWSFSLV